MTLKHLQSLVLCVLVLMVLAPANRALAAPVSVAERTEAFGAFLAEFRKDRKIRALTAVIVQDGQILWEQALGTADDEREAETTMDTSFRVASVTKPIAAAAILAEVEAGDLSLNLPLTSDPRWTDFCEWFSGSPIPFGGGGRDNDGTEIAPVDCDRGLTLKDILNMRVNGAAGAGFVYNPMTYARIDRAIEGAGGRPLRAIVRERVLDPAGVANVALGWRDPQGGSALRLLAPPFTVQDDGRDIKASQSDDDFRAAAGIIASARQLARIDIALDAGKLLSAKRMAQIFAGDPVPVRGDYRWGWFVQDWNGERLAWHSGWEPDRYSALYLKLPARKLTLILLANNENLWWNNALSAAEVHKSPVAAEFLKLFASGR